MASIISAFEADFLAQYQSRLLPSHRKALAAMKGCRSQLGPKMQATCDSCHTQVFVPHSCGHRNCPHCQSHESQLQGTPGATAVLHTHSRHLDYHPHTHLVVPGAALNADKRLWRTKQGKGKRRYLFSHKALAKVFHAKLLEAITRAGLSLPNTYPEDWVLDCKAVGSGEKALAYLGRYLYRGVIQEKDIIACENGQIIFRYRNGKTREIEHRTVPGAQFLWLIVQHVLPKGFRRARNYGLLHPNSKRLIQLIQYLLNLWVGPNKPLLRERPKLICSCCGAAMKIIRTRIPRHHGHRIKAGVELPVM